MEQIQTVIAVVIIFGLLVGIHELGHFLAAKLSGVHVEEFAIGFGPKLWQRNFRGTLYRINLLPFGGFVKLEGDQPGDAPTEGSFVSKPLRVKLFIFFAGVIMNVILAIVLYAFYLHLNNYIVGYQQISDFHFVGAEQASSAPAGIIVSNVQADSPATNKLESGDVISNINDTKIESSSQFLQALSDNQGKTVDLKVWRTVKDTAQISEIDVNVTLRNKQVDGDKPLLGISLNYADRGFFLLKYPTSALSALPHTWNMFWYQLSAIGKFIEQSVQQKSIQPLAEQVGSVVEVVDVINQIISVGLVIELINLTAIVSLTLAFFNLLPVPIFDGGQALIAVIEKIKGKPLKPETLNLIYLVSVVFLVILTVLLVIKDAIQIQLLNNVVNTIKGILGR
jgi:regulator of sigma E protease